MPGGVQPAYSHTVVTLQRCAGNASVARFLAAMHAEGEPDRVPASARPQPAPNPPARLLQRQRKIGFELEDGDWLSWKTEAVDDEEKGGERGVYWRSPHDRRGVRPLTKHEHLHDGTGLTLEADTIDDEAGNGVSDLEFVTRAFPLTPDGYGELGAAMEELIAIYARLRDAAGRRHDRGQFVTPDVHRLNQDGVLLSRGQAEARLNVQATHGLALEDIPKTFTALAAPPAKQDQRLAVGAIQHGMHGDRDVSNDRIMEVLRSAPERAVKLSLAHLRPLMDDPAMQDVDALHGLLTAAIAFVRMMRIAPIVDSLKPFLPMMHRNDFATMRRQLHPDQQRLLKANALLVEQAIIVGALGDLEGSPEKFDFAANYSAPMIVNLRIANVSLEKLFPGLDARQVAGLRVGGKRVPANYRPISSDLWISQWVGAWMNGLNAIDMLTEEHAQAASKAAYPMRPDALLDDARRELEAVHRPLADAIDWGRSRATDKGVKLTLAWDKLDARQKAAIAGSMRGLGHRGEATDEDDPRLLLFENRAFAPTVRDMFNKEHGRAMKLSVDTATRSVMEYFAGFVGLLGR